MWEFSLASHLLFATDTAHEAKKSGAAVDFRALSYTNYHALTAIMARPWLRRPVFFLIRVVYHLGYFARHRRFS